MERLRLKAEDGWHGILYGPIVGAGLKKSAKPLGRDEEMGLSKDGL